MANEGIVYEIYSYTNPTAAKPKWIVPGRQSPQYMEQLKDNGGGSFKMPKLDPKYVKDPTMLDSRNVVRVKIDGAYVGAFLLGTGEGTLISTEEYKGMGILAAGAGLKSWFDDAQVAGIDGNINSDTAESRYFNFASASRGNWYDASKWVDPNYYGVVRQPGHAWSGDFPDGWPAVLNAAKWFGPYAYDFNLMPFDPYYIRWEVGIATASLYAVYVAVDDQFTLYVDGEELGESDEKGAGWRKATRVEVPLTAGTHTIALRANNRKATGYNGPTAALMGLTRIKSDGSELYIGRSDGLDGVLKVLPGPIDTPGWTVGEMLLTLLNEASARGIRFPNYLTPTFTSSTDSYGQPWAEKHEWSFSVGESYASVLSNIESMYDVWIDANFKLNIVPQRGKDRSVATYKSDGSLESGPIRFEYGKHIIGAGDKTRGKIKNSFQLKTTEGWSKVEDATSIAKYGKLETSMETKTNKLTSNKLAGLLLKQRAIEEEGATYELIVDPYVPWVKFGVGDWVLAPNRRGLYVKRRVMSLTVEELTNGRKKYSIEFDVIFQDNESRLNGAVEKLGGSGVGGKGPGIGITPGGKGPGQTFPGGAPTAPTPKRVTGLAATSEGYWPPDGIAPKSTVTLTWAPVSQATNDSQLIPVRYDVEGDDASTPEEGWTPMGSFTTATAKITNFVPNINWQFRVRAVGEGEKYGAWSTTLNHKPVSPNVPMLAPSKPTLGSERGLIRVTWDGNLSDGTVAPPQFRYTWLEYRKVGSSIWVSGAQVVQRGGGDSLITNVVVGNDYEVRLAAIDGVKLVSPYSETSTIKVVGTDLGSLGQDVKDAVAAAKQAGDDAMAKALTAEQIGNAANDLAADAKTRANNAQTSADGKGRNIYSTAAGLSAFSPFTRFDTWFDTANGNKPYNWVNNAWVSRLFEIDAFGNVVSKTITDTVTAAANATVLGTQAQLGVNAALMKTVNRVTDPSFGSGVMTIPASATGWSIVDNKGRSDNFSLMRSPTPGGITSVVLSQVAGNSTAYLHVPVTPGAVWEIGGWVITTADYNGTANGSKLRLGDQTNTFMGNGSLGIGTPRTSWSWETMRVRIPSDGSVTSIRFSVLGDNTAGTIWWDDVVLRDVSDVVAAEEANSLTLAAANGKNRTTYAATDPDTNGTRQGDIWYRLSGNLVIGLWTWTGSAWAKRTIDGQTVANLDAGSITSGYINSALINANTITTRQIVMSDFTNLIGENYGFEYGSTGWNLGAGASILDIGSANTPVGGTKVLNVLSQTNVISDTNALGVDTAPDEVWYAECYVRKTGAGTTGSIGLQATLLLDGVIKTYPAFKSIAMSALVQNQWIKLSGQITIPAGVNRLIVRPSVRNDVAGGQVIQFDNVVLRKAAQASLLVDGSIGAGSAVIGTAAISAAQIGSVNAGTINAGYISTDRFRAGSIGTNKLLVTSLENLCLDPSFEYTMPNNPADNPNATSTDAWTFFAGRSWCAYYTDPALTRTGSQSLRIGTLDVAYVAASQNQTIGVSRGDRYRVGYWVKLAGSDTRVNNGGISARFQWSELEAGPYTSGPDVVSCPTDLTNEWMYLTGDWTVPDSARYIRLQIVQRDVSNVVKTYIVDDVEIFKMLQGTLIVDGTIKGIMINADEITGRHIKGKTISGENIQSETITSELIKAEAIKGIHIEFQTLEGDKIKTGTLEVSHVSPTFGRDLVISGNLSIISAVDAAAAAQASADGVGQNVAEMQTYYFFGPDGAVISKPGSVFSTAIRSDRIEMLENGNVISYWNSGTLYVNQLETGRVKLASHQFESFGTDGTVVRSIG